MDSTPIVYCLTRDRELAEAIDGRLAGAIAFFYNDAGRLHQAVTLRPPTLVVVDTGAVRAEYGDAGLGPVVAFLRDRAPGAAIAVRPTAGVEHLVAAEAGPGVELLPHDLDACVTAVAANCGIRDGA
jgi:hypothetical protein